MTAISLEDLSDLLVNGFKSDKKITTIKTIRQLTGASLRDSKELCEYVLHMRLNDYVVPEDNDTGEVPKPLNPVTSSNPPMFLVGHSYEQVDGNVVLMLGLSNRETSHETIYSIDDKGNVVHRYNRRDFGRVTGTSFTEPDPRNLKEIS